MKPIDVKEDIESRRWYSNNILNYAYAITKYWWLKSIILSVVVVSVYYALNVPKVYYAVALLLTLTPLGLAIIFALIHPIFLLPQRWRFQEGKIIGRGVRALGSLKTRHIQEWSIQEITELSNHSIARLKWKCWAGILQGDTDILITEPSQAAQIKKYLEYSA